MCGEWAFFTECPHRFMPGFGVLDERYITGAQRSPNRLCSFLCLHREAITRMTPLLSGWSPAEHGRFFSLSGISQRLRLSMQGKIPSSTRRRGIPPGQRKHLIASIFGGERSFCNSFSLTSPAKFSRTCFSRTFVATGTGTATSTLLDVHPQNTLYDPNTRPPITIRIFPRPSRV